MSFQKLDGSLFEFNETAAELPDLVSKIKSLDSLEGTRPREWFMEIYSRMKLIREFENRAYQVYLQRKIGGFCHIYSGQEAVAVGAYSAIVPGEDYSITAYRDHGHALAAGLSPDSVMAELYGKATGCSRGKGGSMHLFDTDLKFMGGHAIVGGHLPLAAGLGFSVKYRDEDRVVLCFLGDGAMNQGSVHEALNLISLHDLPVVIICENNNYGMGTSVERASAEPDLYRRPDAYRMPGFRIDGLDVFTVFNTIDLLAMRAREQCSPAFVETMTYRFRGHSMSDPADYRSAAEEEKYRQKDPLDRLAGFLLDEKDFSETELEEIDSETEKRVSEALDFAEESPEPDDADLYEDVYDSYPEDLS